MQPNLTPSQIIIRMAPAEPYLWLSFASNFFQGARSGEAVPVPLVSGYRSNKYLAGRPDCEYDAPGIRATLTAHANARTQEAPEPPAFFLDFFLWDTFRCSAIPGIPVHRERSFLRRSDVARLAELAQPSRATSVTRLRASFSSSASGRSICTARFDFSPSSLA